ncbi:hypothetical protein BGX24_006202 [Mortierella sp. AD032]|nr:hypothetical protein BGX24_006202 [Mortierella sp. AD032]
MEACIRNCSAKAPILSNPQSNDLKELGTESAQHQMETLRQELVAKYQHLDAEIASQDDIGDMLSAIQEIMNKDEFKLLFLEHSVDHIHDIDEDDEEEEDLEIPDVSLSDNDHGEPTLALRSTNTHFRDNERLSPPYSPLVEEYRHFNKESFINSLDRLRRAIVAIPDKDLNVLKPFVFIHRAVDGAVDYLESKTPDMYANIYNNIASYSDALLYSEQCFSTNGNSVR